MVNTILAKRVNHIVAKGGNPAWPKGSKSRGFSSVYLFGDVFLARDALAQYRDTQVRGRDLPYLVVYLFNAPFVRSRMGTIIDTE